jgi:hypothetical protein
VELDLAAPLPSASAPSTPLDRCDVATPGPPAITELDAALDSSTGTRSVDNLPAPMAIAPGEAAGNSMDAGVTSVPGEAGPAVLPEQTDASTALEPVNTIIPLTPLFITANGERCDTSCPAHCCTTTEGVFIAPMSGEQCDDSTGAVIIDAWDSSGQNRYGRAAATYCNGLALMYVSAEVALQEAAVQQGSDGYAIFGEMVDAEGNALLAVSDDLANETIRDASNPALLHRPAQFRLSVYLYERRSP